MDADGGLTVEFAISDVNKAAGEETRASDTWSIRTTRLDVTGTTLLPAEVEPQ